MKARFVATAFAACQIVMGSSPLFAQDGYGLLTRAQKWQYHQCLYGSFIQNHCRFDAWGSSVAAYRECVIANKAGRIPPAPYWGFWGLGINDVCRELIQTGVY